jgi:hypothetical protein
LLDALPLDGQLDGLYLLVEVVDMYQHCELISLLDEGLVEAVEVVILP